MKDMIDRQAAIDALRTCYDTEAITHTNGNEYIDYDQALDLINTLPSAQPERKRGRWTLIGMKKYKTVGRTPDQKEVLLEKEWRREEKIQCSCCGEITMLDYSITYQFCPHCGADMREDNHETD